MANTDNIVIGPVRVAFPDIWDGSPNDNNVLKYGLTILIDKNTEAGKALKAKLQELAGQAVTKAWPDKASRPPKLTNPIHDGDSGDDTDDGIPKSQKFAGFAGHWYASVSSQFAPGVLYRDKSRLVKGKDNNVIYGGCWCYIQLNAYTFDNKKKGVSFGLQNVMFSRDDEKLGQGAPKPEDAFADIKADGGAAATEDMFGN